VRGVKNIKVLCTGMTVPDCMKGSSLAYGKLQELEKGVTEKNKKTEICCVWGGEGHLFQVLTPLALWEKILDVELVGL
jgi:hypothetical protein